MSVKKESENFLSKLHYGEEPEEVGRFRTEYCLNWYTRKAIFYKRLFNCLSVINVAIPLGSTIIFTQLESSLGGALLSAIASFSASLLALFNVRDKWLIYRSAAEYIKSQYTLYCAKAFPYEGEDAHTKYILMIEKYMSDVHVNWYTTQNPAGEVTESISKRKHLQVL